MFGKYVKIYWERNNSRGYQKNSETRVFMCVFSSAKNDPKGRPHRDIFEGAIIFDSFQRDPSTINIESTSM